MKRSLLAVAGVLIAASATAQPRPSTLQMTCGQAAALIASQGGIVLGTGGDTYDRFVAHRGFCLRSEAAGTVWVPTRDTPNCHLWRCKEAEHMDR
jgi:hypothetical protein